MSSHSVIIDRLGGPAAIRAELAELGIEVKPVTTRAWKARGRIPAKFWPAIQRVGEKRQRPVSLAELVEAVAA